MNVKEAVAVAKSHLADLFGDEKPANIGLEEVEFDDHDNTWRVTVGFSRPWELNTEFDQLSGRGSKRSFKVVTISDADSHVRSVKDRELVR